MGINKSHLKLLMNTQMATPKIINQIIYRFKRKKLMKTVLKN